MTDSENNGYLEGADLSSVAYKQRVLLLPHCLRPSQTCPGKMTKAGLDCGECAEQMCVIHQLRRVALEAGYGGVCVAPGGRLAVSFVGEQQPKAVVAVACSKEIEEGRELLEQMEANGGAPLLLTVRLIKDGCVDTVVDVETARRAILE